MNYNDIYDVLFQIFNLNIDFNIIFDKVDEPNKSEILKFIDFIKNSKSKNDLVNYNLSEKSKKIILNYIDYIFKKLK